MTFVKGGVLKLDQTRRSTTIKRLKNILTTFWSFIRSEITQNRVCRENAKMFCIACWIKVHGLVFSELPKSPKTTYLTSKKCKTMTNVGKKWDSNRQTPTSFIGPAVSYFYWHKLMTCPTSQKQPNFYILFQKWVHPKTLIKEL